MGKLRLGFPGFQMPPTTSGSGAIKSLAQAVDLERAVFLVSGQEAVWSYVDGALSKAGAKVSVERRLVKSAGEPTVESIRAGADFLRAQRASIVVAIGGGSVLDWARLAWADSIGRLDLDRGVMGPTAPEERARFVLVPTTCASGAEGATVAVYSVAGRKQPVVSPVFLADRVVLDGHFLASLDDVSLSASLSDALTHSVESLVSLVPNGIAKSLAGASLRLVLEYADGGRPVASRADHLLEASYLAGVAASHTSVGIAHAFAHAMAGQGLTHGRGNAIALAPALRFNADAPAMAGLRSASGLSDAELISRVRTITSPARRAGAALTMKVLDDSAQRTQVLDGMLADTALRSNPIRAGAEEIERFLALVREEVASS
jgi:alcohol dehydrogenase class IV